MHLKKKTSMECMSFEKLFDSNMNYFFLTDLPAKNEADLIRFD